MPDAYYRWLVEIIGDGYTEGFYQKLLWKLYSTPYYYEIDFDGNRAADGLNLRRKYFVHVAQVSSDDLILNLQYPCSVLEMLIALGIKAEDNLTYDPNKGDSTGRWFWTILNNLRLDSYTDYNYFDNQVNDILSNFMHHNYAPDGTEGGAFPCPGVEKDLRKTDLWWQLGAFFKKYYPVKIW